MIAMMMGDPCWPNYLIIYYIMFIVVLYEDYLPTIIVGGCGTILLIIFYIMYKNTVFKDISLNLTLPFLFLYGFFGGYTE